MEPKETYLVKRRVIKKTPIEMMAAYGNMAIIKPNKVATPLPP